MQVSLLALCICHAIKSGFESCNCLAACMDCVLLFVVFDAWNIQNVNQSAYLLNESKIN